MNNPSVDNRGANRPSGVTVVLAATLVALLAVFVLAKPSGAQVVVDPVTLTVDETEVGFGAVLVDGVNGTVVTRTITVTNTGSTPITIGDVTLTGDAGEILDFTTDIGTNGLTVAGGGANTFTISFDPSAEGTRDATLTLLEGLVDGTTGQIIGLTGETVGLVDEAGNTVQGIDLSGSGSSTDPFLQPGAQGCTIVGTNNGEVLTGTSARDVICALGGADRVSSRGGNDLVKGGGGSDVVRMSKGADVLKGGSGNDRITDKAGKDKLYGQGGKDTLNTRDRMRGDLLVGGPSRDKAVKDRGDRARSI